MQIIDVVLATAICGQLYATRHRVNGRPRNAMTDNRLTSFSRLMMSSSVFAGAIQLSVIGVWYSYITSTTSSWLYLPLVRCSPTWKGKYSYVSVRPAQNLFLLLPRGDHDASHRCQATLVRPCHQW